MSLPGLCWLGVTVGVFTGLLGIGGGVLFVPIFLLGVGLTPHQAVGTSLGVILFGSVGGTISHGMMGNVNLLYTMAMLTGSAVGVQVGAGIADRLHGTRLRRGFSIFLLAVVALLAWDFFRRWTLHN